MKKQLISLDFGGVVRLVNLPAPAADTDAVSKSYVLSQIQSAITGLDYQADVLGIQTDATLAPTLTAGARYIVTNVSTLNAGFSTIVGVENGDIVEYNGSAFTVAYDVSVKGDGVLCFNKGDNQFYKYVSGTWSYGGLSAVTAGTGLENIEGTFNVKYDNVTIGIDGSGKLYIPDDAITKAKIASDVAGTGLEQDTDGSLKVKLDGDTLAAGANGLKFNKTILQKVTADIGDGSSTSIDVPHTLGTKDVQVSVYSNSTGEDVNCGITRTDTNTVTLTFDSAPASGAYRVVITG